MAGNAGSGGGDAGTMGTGSDGGTGGSRGAGGAIGGAAGGGGGGTAGGGRGGGTAGATGGAGRGGAGAGGATSPGATIVNDTFWKDTAGNFIYSQGGGALRVGDTYYWYGVKYAGAVTYAANPTGKNSSTGFQGITTYSSTDLVNWKLETVSKPANTGGWFGRLGVVYHAATKKYVLVAQGGGGLYFATADAPGGPFVYSSVQTNLPGIANGSTGDQTMFQDDDGAAYLVALEQQRPVEPLPVTAARFRFPGSRASDPRVFRRRPRGQLYVQVQWHVLLLLVGSARLELVTELLRVVIERQGTVVR